jgi:hypothetical protein
VQRSALGFCIIEEREDTERITMLTTTMFLKTAVGRHDESSIFRSI